MGFSDTLHAQTVLNIYGPGGPAAAMLEAAKAFGTAHSISVNFIAGPTPELVEKAKHDADIIFSGSEGEFAKALPGAFEMKDAYPLYLRPAAILVRPGNPKNKHLRLSRSARPECQGLHLGGEVATRTGDIAIVRAFCKNMVFPEAADSGAAKEQWARQMRSMPG